MRTWFIHVIFDCTEVQLYNSNLAIDCSNSAVFGFTALLVISGRGCGMLKGISPWYRRARAVM